MSCQAVYVFRTWVDLSVQSMAHNVIAWLSVQGRLHKHFEYAHSCGDLSYGVFNCTVTIKWVKGGRDELLSACLKVRSV